MVISYAFLDIRTVLHSILHLPFADMRVESYRCYLKNLSMPLRFFALRLPDLRGFVAAILPAAECMDSSI